MFYRVLTTTPYTYSVRASSLVKYVSKQLLQVRATVDVLFDLLFAVEPATSFEMPDDGGSLLVTDGGRE